MSSERFSSSDIPVNLTDKYLNNENAISFVPSISERSLSFKDGTRVEINDPIMELHIVGNSNLEESNYSRYKRGKQFMINTIKNLAMVSEACMDDDKLVKDINVFMGISDLLRPSFVDKLGFSKEHYRFYEDQEIAKVLIADYRIGMSENRGNAKVGDVYELWITKTEMLNAFVPLTTLYLQLENI